MKYPMFFYFSQCVSPTSSFSLVLLPLLHLFLVFLFIFSFHCFTFCLSCTFLFFAFSAFWLFYSLFFLNFLLPPPPPFILSLMEAKLPDIAVFLSTLIHTFRLYSIIFTSVILHISLPSVESKNGPDMHLEW